MPPFKINIKLGQFEFNAEGEEASVKEQLSAFMAFVNEAKKTTPTPVVPATPKKDGDGEAPPIIVNPEMEKIYIREKDLLSLRIHPDGVPKEEAKKSLLLLLYGYKTLLGKDDVNVALIAKALRKSGTEFYRVADMSQSLEEENLIGTTGVRKGVQYRITNKGVASAEGIIEAMKAKF